MPKCENCQYLKKTSYEYGEYECEIFGGYQGEDVWNPITAKYEPTEDGHMFTEEGCKYTRKQLAQMFEEVQNAQNKYYESYEGYAEWEKEWEAKEKQLKEDLKSGKKHRFDREDEIKCPWCGEVLDSRNFYENWTLQKCQNSDCNKWFSVHISELYTTERQQQICNKEHPKHPDYKIKMEKQNNEK